MQVHRVPSYGRASVPARSNHFRRGDANPQWVGANRQNGGMRISAKADYAVRAALELAAADDPPIKAERVAEAQGIPLKFLENILVDLRHEGLVTSQRGPLGGYRLRRPGAAGTPPRAAGAGRR